MITSIGIDIAETDRLRKDIERFGERFVGRILGPLELDDYHALPDKAGFLAGQFAAKEAVVKALGHYLKDRPALNTIEVLSDEAGLRLHLPTDVSERLNDARCLISISHTECHATAMAIFTEDK